MENPKRQLDAQPEFTQPESTEPKNDNVIREVVFGDPPPIDDIVKCLEELLELARAGRVQKFICAAQEPSGYVTTLWRFSSSRFVEAAGMSAMLHSDILNDAIMRKLSEVSEEVGLPIDV